MGGSSYYHSCFGFLLFPVVQFEFGKLSNLGCTDETERIMEYSL